MASSVSKIARMRDRVILDAPKTAPDGVGGQEVGWSEQFTRRAEFMFLRGSEAVDAAALAGRAVFKVRLHQSAAARTITSDWRMRDARRGLVYNIRSVDALTNRAWIFLTVESGVGI